MKFAFVFPGQGAQAVGMMNGFSGIPVVRQTFSEASEVLGQDLWALVAEGPESALNQTINTQPVMLTAGIAVYRAWEDLHGPEPAVMAGHSLGEYSALVASGALAFADALKVVRLRAQAMQEAVPEGSGGIAAILGLDDEAVAAVCRDAAQGEVLEPANYNSPAQVVIAGHRSAVERGMALAKQRGAKRAVMLAMSAPSHCSLMQPAAERLAQALAGVAVQSPQIPVLHNVDVAEHHDAASIRDALVRQVCSPVRWVEIIRQFAARGVSHVVECGPGKVLTGLNKRIEASQQVLALTDSASLREALAVINS
ncbi:MAG: [acyl-carrier-protein] S-malonyltransferase [Azospira oryzae]|nr:MAG: [acyl-carrier-protein] S-malonyltransferase [Azospira oryzae]PZP82813.1 MAG: [acyl-carrier-protein] S-malonyltransferase [Azospira oryzae]